MLIWNSLCLKSFLRHAKPVVAYHSPNYFAYRPIIVFWTLVWMWKLPTQTRISCTPIQDNLPSQGENATVPMPAPQCYLPEMSTQPFICTSMPQQQPAFGGSHHQGLSESVHNPTKTSENPFDPSMDSESSIEGSLWSLGPYGIDKQPILSQTFDFFPHLDTLGGSMDFGT